MPSRMMAIGLSGFATSDVFYGLFRFYGVTDQTVYGVLGLGILSCYISFAVGALHPSMKTMDQPLPDLPPVRIWRLILLAGAALIAPVVLFIETFRGRVEEVAPIVAVFSAVMFTLVIMRLFTLIRDISQRDAEITLERQRTELIYLASHQLRTPAAAVKSSLSLLIDGYLGKLSEKQEQELKVAYEENDHELQLVNDILNVIQLDSRNLPIEVKPTDLAAVVKEAVKGELPTAESKHQKLTVGPAEQAVAEVDADKLLTVMKVLVTNAVKYTPDDGVIQLSVSDGRDQVVVRVKDNGIGISDDDLPDLFKRFSRARNATQINMAGAGLGLYIAKNIVEAHHGTIEVDSELGHGSVFTVKVPKKFLS
jgi:signal transduction histidine kinase